MAAIDRYVAHHAHHVPAYHPPVLQPMHHRGPGVPRRTPVLLATPTASTARLAGGEGLLHIAAPAKPAHKLTRGTLSANINNLPANLQAEINKILESGAVNAAEQIASLLALAFGCLACAAIIGVGFGIYELLSALGIVGSGKPKLEDTVQAAQRLLGTQALSLQILGMQLAYLAQNQVPVSSDAPGVQTLISGLVHTAVLGLEQEYGWTRAHAAAVIATYISGQLQCASCWSVPKPVSGPSGLPPSSSFPSPPPSLPPPISPSLPSSPGPSPYLPPYSPQTTRPPYAGMVAGGLAALLSGQPEMIIPGAIMGGELQTTSGEIVSQIDQYVSNYWGRFTGQGGGQNLGSQSLSQRPQTPPPGYPSGGQPEFPPLSHPVPDLQPCPECGYNPDAEQQNELVSQQQQLSREISTEQNQQLIQQIQDQQRELNRLRGLENQPASQRNIPQELQEKAQLQQAIQLVVGSAGKTQSLISHWLILKTRSSRKQ